MRRAYAFLALAFAAAAYFAVRRHHAASPAARAAVPALARTSPRAVPRALLPAARAVNSHRLVALGWGDGPGQVGRRRGPESQAEGPMALAAARDGSLYLLDQVHGRVLHRRRDGSFDAPIAIGDVGAQDLRPDAHGLAILDRTRERGVLRVEDGRIDSVPLASIGVTDPGGATGLFVDDQDRLYVEESLAGEGRRVDYPLDGGPALPGRSSRDGALLLRATIGTSTPRGPRNLCVVRGLAPGGGERFHTALWTGAPILAVVLLDADDAGGIYVGTLSASPTSGRDLGDETLDVFRLDPDGQAVDQIAVAHPPSPYASFRELEVAGVGVVWWMHAAPDGSGFVIDELSL